MSNESLALIFSGSFLSVCLAVFSLRQISYGRHHHPRVQKDGGSVFVGGTFFMDFAYWLFSPVTNFLVSLKVSPNSISLTCMVLSMVSGYFFAIGEFAWAGWLWGFASVLDALDGSVARAQEKATLAGSVIDSTVDRVSELAVFTGLAFYYREDSAILLTALLALSGSVLTSYITAKGDILRVKLPRGVMRRAERAVYIGIAGVFSPLMAFYNEAGNSNPSYYLMAMVLLVIAVFSLGSSAYRVFWLCQELDRREQNSNEER